MLPPITQPDRRQSRSTAPGVADTVPAGLRRETPFFPEVESLRGIAILLVLFHHADGLMTPHLADGGIVVSPVGAFVAGGQTGVSLFFVLSAFCLSLPLFRAMERGEPVSWRRFYERRALRILPAYWTAIFVGAIVSGSALSAPWGVLPYPFFLNSIPNLAVSMRPFSDVWWSLATEVQFYLLLPLLPLALSTPRRKRIAAAFLACYASLFAASQFGWFGPSDTVLQIYFGLSVIGRGPVFLAGVAVAWLWARRGEEWRDRLATSRLFRGGAADAVFFPVLFALGSLLSWQVLVGYWPAERPGYLAWHVAEGVLWALVLLMLLVLPLRTKALFCNRALDRIGIWSYSIYLIHLPVIVYSFTKLRQTWPMNHLGWNRYSLTALGLVTLGCITLSALTYRFIEKPFLVKKARCSKATATRACA